MKESRKEREKNAAASSESTVPQEDKKAEAAKDEGPQHRICRKQRCRQPQRSLTLVTETKDRTKKRRHSVSYKRT